MNKVLPILSLCLFFASCDQNISSTQPVEEKNEAADWEITAKVKEDILSDESLSAENRLVSVSTLDGVVTLSGIISSQDQIDHIIDKVKSIPEVKGVNNQMKLPS